MLTTLNENIKPGDIYIVGNAPEKNKIQINISQKDTIVRFNQPNTSCSLKADILFIANGQYRISRQEDIKTDLVNSKYQVIWRYNPIAMFLGQYENISVLRRLKYPILFHFYKKNNHPNCLNNYYLSIKEYKSCEKWLGFKPSTGFLAIYIFLKYFPKKKIFLHNFTFEGTKAHNWVEEKKIIHELIDVKRLFLIKNRD